MNNFSVRLFMVAALVCGVFFLANCGGGSTTTTTNNAAPANKAANAPKTETASTDSVGVAECDEYIKKYEACLTKIAEKAPQAQPGLKTAFEQQRNGFKAAASTAEGKTQLATQCKQMIETAKTSTSAYACTW
jgi:hypothetical protein